MLTTNVCPALAVTPQEATFCVAKAVLVAEYRPHRSSLVGKVVGTDDGAGEGAVGAAVGNAEGAVKAMVGPTVGNDEGAGVGKPVVGRSVGRVLGSAVGRGVPAIVGIALGRKVGATVGNATGARLGAGVGSLVGRYVTP